MMICSRPLSGPWPCLASLLCLSLWTIAVPVAEAGGSNPLTTDPENPRWLFFQDGAPFFMCGPGDPEDFLHRGTLDPDGTRNGDQDAMIAEITGTGANAIIVMAVRSHGGDGNSTHNPFVDHDPALGLNEAVLDQWEGWITALDAAGVVTTFTFYDDGARPWNTGSTVGAQEQAFFEAVVDRFEHLDHLIWCVMEEYEEAYPEERVVALAALIAATDDFDHPITVHQLNGSTFDFPDESNLHAFSMQINDTLDDAAIHDRVVEAYGMADGRYNAHFDPLPARATRDGAPHHARRGWTPDSPPRR